MGHRSHSTIQLQPHDSVRSSPGSQPRGSPQCCSAPLQPGSTASHLCFCYKIFSLPVLMDSSVIVACSGSARPSSTDTTASTIGTSTPILRARASAAGAVATPSAVSVMLAMMSPIFSPRPRRTPALIKATAQASVEVSVVTESTALELGSTSCWLACCACTRFHPATATDVCTSSCPS